VARWDESVQHFGGAGVHMDRPARLYLCARCRAQVILCSRCDRGNRYCGRQCRHQAREQARREAAQRYQRSWRGRIAHAQRSRRWRQRRAQREAARDAGGSARVDTQNVTHQGSQPAVVWAPLAAWTHDSTTVEPAETADGIAAPAVTHEATISAPCWTCRRCGRPQAAAVRQGFLRHGLPGRRRHDHSP
jgi:hypothetical protein